MLEVEQQHSLSFAISDFKVLVDGCLKQLLKQGCVAKMVSSVLYSQLISFSRYLLIYFLGFIVSQKHLSLHELCIVISFCLSVLILSVLLYSHYIGSYYLLLLFREFVLFVLTTRLKQVQEVWTSPGFLKVLETVFTSPVQRSFQILTQDLQYQLVFSNPQGARFSSLN